MTQRTSRTWYSLLALWLIGLLLATGSKVDDRDEEEPVDPVTVAFVVTGNGDVTLENGDTIDTVSSLMVSGSFVKGGNAAITLREVPVTLDTTTTFNLGVVPTDGDNLLDGSLEVNITQDLEFGLDRLPTSGELSLLRDGTTTLITFNGDSNNVAVAVGNDTPISLSFDNLRSYFSDQDQSLDERFASKAYRALESIWLISRFSETAQLAITDNLDTLESMGRNSALSLTCGNTTGTPSPSYSVTWTVDPAGTGLGQPGNGDTFEMSWLNCLFSDDNRYLQSGFRIANYQLENDVAPRNMSYSAILNSTLISEEALDTTTSSPSLTNGRVDGTLLVSATEGAAVTTTN